MPTKDAAPPRFATPFMTLAALPPGQYVGSTRAVAAVAAVAAAEDESAVEDESAASASVRAPPSTHSPEHTERSFRMSSSESTGRHPPGSSMPQEANTREARATSSRRTRMSLTGSPRPTTRPGGAGALTSTARRSAPARSTAGAAPRSTASTTAPETAAASPTIEEDAIAAVIPATSSAVVAPSVAPDARDTWRVAGSDDEPTTPDDPAGTEPALDEELPATTRPAGTETRCIALNPDARTGGDAESMPGGDMPATATEGERGHRVARFIRTRGPSARRFSRSSRRRAQEGTSRRRRLARGRLPFPDALENVDIRERNV